MEEMHELLGQGGDGRIVAVGHVIRKDYRRAKSFLAELEALQNVHHESIVVLVGVCYDSLSLYLPRYDLDLCAALLNGVSVDWGVVASSLLGAVAACHRSRLVHRDIKPENVLVMRREKPTFALCDFARSIMLPPDADQVDVAFCGTLCYGAPEALLGSYSAASDNFSAGVLLFAAATQGLPFEDDELCGDEEIPPPLEDVEETRADLLRGLLRWRPADRLSAAAALAALAVLSAEAVTE
jgi:serine/threonine protein kinase